VKAAVIAVVGRPSSGKSTLVNTLCGGKVSIVSPVPQTTRNRIRGILTEGRGQIVFIDTPGAHRSAKKINLFMSRLVSSTLSEADAALYVVDGTRDPGDEERMIQEALRAAGRPVVACINKLDARGPAWTEARRALAASFPQTVIHDISASRGDGVEALREALFAVAPEGDLLYPEDYYTDQTPEFRISEIVREKAMLQTREEVPHSLYVRIEDVEPRENGTVLWARGFLCVERESQKAIVVGREGERIRSILREAERELSEIFPQAVRLDMRVKVDRDWRKRDPLLRKLIC
jgi:GTP-binding protein Era